MKKKDNGKTEKMSLARFGSWLQEKSGAQIIESPGRLEGVISIDHIEAGCFAALYALPARDGLTVFELCDHFPDENAAWQALQGGGETYPPLPIKEWAAQQYIADPGARVERLEI